VPKSIRPEDALTYDNLVFSCGCCNHSKAAHLVPDPCRIAYGTCVEVTSNGEIRPLNDNGIALIEALGLDAEDYREFRLAVFEWLEELSPLGRSSQRLFGYPKNLPDLSQEPVPPGGNRRPKGIRDSYFERSKRGELTQLY